MKYGFIQFAWRAGLAVILTSTLASCKRENTYQDCFPDDPLLTKVIDTKGIIRLVDTPSDYMIFIAPQGMDTQRYIPCNLPESFKTPNLEVIVSGLAKGELDPCFTPGCPLPFVITAIGKQE
jgi:hypothetical protein